MPADELQSDSARVVSHERERDWPDTMKIVARWGKKEVAVTISKEQFFGLGVYGAPMSGDFLLGAVDRLRKGKK